MISPEYVSMYSTCQPALHSHMLGTVSGSEPQTRLWVTGPRMPHRIPCPLPGPPLQTLLPEVWGEPQNSCLKRVWVELRHVAWMPCMCAGHCSMKGGRGVKRREEGLRLELVLPNSAICWMKKLSCLLLALCIQKTIDHITARLSYQGLDTGTGNIGCIPFLYITNIIYGQRVQQGLAINKRSDIQALCAGSAILIIKLLKYIINSNCPEPSQSPLLLPLRPLP